MSKLDWITAVIVAVCVAALGFLIYKTVGLMDTDDDSSAQTEKVITDVPSDGGDAIDASTEKVDTIKDEDGINYEDGDNAGTDADLESDGNDDSSAGEDSEEMGDDNNSKYISEENVSGAYLVIAGSFKQMINAENQVKRLRRKGYENARVAMFNKGAYGVALVDAFDSFSKADQLSTELNDAGIEAAVHKKR